MAQVTLYLDGETAARMKRAARAAGVSQSRWLARLVEERTAQEWPAEVRDMAGAWPAFPLAEDIRKGQPGDLPREVL